LPYLPSKVRQLAKTYLPEDTGIEIEINPYENGFNSSTLQEIFYGKGCVDSSFDHKEARFRIPSGEEGMIVLYKICLFLKQYMKLNMMSGIHYHTSAPFLTLTLNTKSILPSGDMIVYSEVGKNYPYRWALDELATWGYTGTYNTKGISVELKRTWINLRPSCFNTIEYRIGEMTFDYELMIKRIIHCHSITKRIHSQLISEIKNNPDWKVTTPSIWGV
jgi:hypothetical protein